MYQRQKAVDYAEKWAYKRNPAYYNFDEIGGDCTNFISQCIYAGSGVMNYTPDVGWYYISASNRSAAWTGVPYLYNFLTTNKGPGPFGKELSLDQAQIGDVIQLSFDSVVFSHSLLVTQTGTIPSPENILLATHTYDAFDRPLNTYSYQLSRLIHIEDIRF